jgi:hypothetical protein
MPQRRALYKNAKKIELKNSICFFLFFCFLVFLRLRFKKQTAPPVAEAAGRRSFPPTAR